jgi:Lon protease-like protein
MIEIPLFPLNTVLFPGGLLPLRIFEARYIDMVSRCMREQSEFGVVLIHEGSETGAEVAIAGVGTAARIVDFQQLPDGLLGLLCRGERRYRIVSSNVHSDGLNVAQVEWLADAPCELKDDYRVLVPVLQKVMTALEAIARFIEPRYEDAGWISYRFAELLPLDHMMQQRLLELDDANERLKLLAPLIEPSALQGR